MTEPTWKRQGFKSPSEYQTYMVNRRGFKSLSEYQKHIVNKKGFRSVKSYYTNLISCRLLKEIIGKSSDPESLFSEEHIDFLESLVGRSLRKKDDK